MSPEGRGLESVAEPLCVHLSLGHENPAGSTRSNRLHAHTAVATRTRIRGFSTLRRSYVSSPACDVWIEGGMNLLHRIRHRERLVHHLHKTRHPAEVGAP